MISKIYSTQVDLELAKINADRPDDDDALRKKLWLRIARHVVTVEKNIKKYRAFLTTTYLNRAMELLNQCNLLKIEDILPFFPDFTRIDDFKVIGREMLYFTNSNRKKSVHR